MKAPAPTLSPLMRSDLQGEVLAVLLLLPEKQYSLTELARITRVSVPRIHSEINRLSEAGVVVEQRVGATRLVSANLENPLTRPLTDLVVLTYGPKVVLERTLGGLPGIRNAYIYGSWAARRSGEAGPPPADLDVVVVGHALRMDLDLAADEAEKTLRRPVNMQQVTPENWQRDDSPFVRQLKSRPLVELVLKEAL